MDSMSNYAQIAHAVGKGCQDRKQGIPARPKELYKSKSLRNWYQKGYNETKYLTKNESNNRK